MHDASLFRVQQKRSYSDAILNNDSEAVNGT
jgi:hypothetical protein